METLHHASIIVHVVFGTLALLVGLVPLLARKGGPLHAASGWWFLGLAAVVLATAVLGLAVFSFRPFLTVVVALSLYQAVAGYRVLRVRATGPRLPDHLLAALFLLGGVAFWLCLPRIRLGWSAPVMYSLLGTLLLLTTYDLSRGLFVAKWRQGYWLYEHIWKMLGCYSALLAAFTGTVLPTYAPYSQLGPTFITTTVALLFMARAGQRAHPRPLAAA